MITSHLPGGLPAEVVRFAGALSSSLSPHVFPSCGPGPSAEALVLLVATASLVTVPAQSIEPPLLCCRKIERRKSRLFSRLPTLNSHANSAVEHALFTFVAGSSARPAESHGFRLSVRRPFILPRRRSQLIAGRSLSPPSRGGQFTLIPVEKLYARILFCLRIDPPIITAVARDVVRSKRLARLLKVSGARELCASFAVCVFSTASKYAAQSVCIKNYKATYCEV